MRTTITRKRSTRPLSDEAKSSLRTTFGRWTHLQLDHLDDLTPEEQGRLVELANKALGLDESRPEPGEPRRLLDPSRLGKRDRARFEALVEKATGTEGLFEELREDRAQQAELDTLARTARQPKPRVRYEQPGSVHFEREILELVAGRALTVEGLGVLAYLEFCFENATSFAPGSSFSSEAAARSSSTAGSALSRRPTAAARSGARCSTSLKPHRSTRSPARATGSSSAGASC